MSDIFTDSHTTDTRHLSMLFWHLSLNMEADWIIFKLGDSIACP